MGAPDRVFSRFIPKEHVGEAASWEFQSLGAATRGGAARGVAAGEAPAVAMLTERERRAYERGLEQGRLEGHGAGVATSQQQAARRGQQLDRLLTSLRARYMELEAQGADALLDLAVEIARQVVRREVEIAREAVLVPLREAVAAVIDQQAHPRVYLHPDDLALVHGELEADGMLKGCRFLPEASVGHGGCRVETQHSEVDATVQTRWRRVIAALGIESDRGLSSADHVGAPAPASRAPD